MESSVKKSVKEIDIAEDIIEDLLFSLEIELSEDGHTYTNRELRTQRRQIIAVRTTLRLLRNEPI